MNTIAETKNVQDRFRDLPKLDTPQEKVEMDALLVTVPYLESIQDRMKEL